MNEMRASRASSFVTHETRLTSREPKYVCRSLRQNGFASPSAARGIDYIAEISIPTRRDVAFHRGRVSRGDTKSARPLNNRETHAGPVASQTFPNIDTVNA